MGYLRSLRKNWKLLAIMRRLGAPRTPQQVLAEAVSGQKSDKERAREELFALVLADPDLREIMQQHGASSESIAEAYSALLLHGAGQWAGGAYVAAAAIATNPTLDHVLSMAAAELPSSLAEGDRWTKISFELVEYFESGRMGAVSSH